METSRPAMKLTSYQEQVLRAFGYGLKRADVAADLNLSTETVDRLVADAYIKLHQLEQRIATTPHFTQPEIAVGL